MVGYDNEDGFFGQFIFGENGWTPPGYEDELWKYYWKNCDYAVSTHGRVWSCNGTARIPSDEAIEKANTARKQPVIAISESDGSQIWFPSQQDAARELKLQKSNICYCLAGQRKHAGGYSFVRAQGGDANANCPEQLY